MQIRYLLIISFCLINLLKVSACDCRRIKHLKDAQKTSYKQSDLIFIGKVISVGKSKKYESQGFFNNTIFEIEVTEGFKGVKAGEVLKGRALTSCSGYPDQDVWLVYADITDSGLISFSTCSLSRSFKKPEKILYHKYLPLPVTRAESENPPPNFELDFIIEVAKIKLMAANDLKKEVAWLRSKK